MVFINYNKSHKKNSRGKSLSRAISGSDDALPTLYGMKAEALADLMNKWKNQKK